MIIQKTEVYQPGVAINNQYLHMSFCCRGFCDKFLSLMYILYFLYSLRRYCKREKRNIIAFKHLIKLLRAKLIYPLSLEFGYQMNWNCKKKEIMTLVDSFGQTVATTSARICILIRYIYYTRFVISCSSKETENEPICSLLSCSNSSSCFSSCLAKQAACCQLRIYSTVHCPHTRNT